MFYDTLPLPYTDDIEAIPVDEADDIERVIEATKLLLARRQAKDGDFVADVHVKAHGYAEGQLRVLPNLPVKLAQGLFGHETDYRAVVRFSNAASWPQPDALPDGRGMAIKVFRVAGDMVSMDEQNGPTQDFLMIVDPTSRVAVWVATAAAQVVGRQRQRAHAARGGGVNQAVQRSDNVRPRPAELHHRVGRAVASGEGQAAVGRERQRAPGGRQIHLEHSVRAGIIADGDRVAVGSREYDRLADPHRLRASRDRVDRCFVHIADVDRHVRHSHRVVAVRDCHGEVGDGSRLEIERGGVGNRDLASAAVDDKRATRVAASDRPAQRVIWKIRVAGHGRADHSAVVAVLVEAKRLVGDQRRRVRRTDIH